MNALHQRAAIGHELAKRARFGKPWGLVYRVSGTQVDCSIYSTGDLDVSAVATRFGGGGHRNASGFSVSLADWLDALRVEDAPIFAAWAATCRLESAFCAPVSPLRGLWPADWTHHLRENGRCTTGPPRGFA